MNPLFLLLTLSAIAAPGVSAHPTKARTAAAGATAVEEGRYEKRDRDEGREHRGRKHRHHHHDEDDDCDDAPPKKDLPPEVAQSCCGFPGDCGNELGVGKFCVTDEDCAKNSAATICSSAENPVSEDHKTFFCTLGCDPNATENVCGSGARCNCEDVGCACAAISCIEHPPAGCEGP
jgi:hypothetical protein